MPKSKERTSKSTPDTYPPKIMKKLDTTRERSSKMSKSKRTSKSDTYPPPSSGKIMKKLDTRERTSKWRQHKSPPVSTSGTSRERPSKSRQDSFQVSSQNKAYSMLSRCFSIEEQIM